MDTKMAVIAASSCVYMVMHICQLSARVPLYPNRR